MVERKCDDCGQMLPENFFHSHGSGPLEMSCEIESLRAKLAEGERVQKTLTEQRDKLELQVDEQQKKYSDLLQSHASLCGKIEEMKYALEVSKPSTIHVLSGHVYGPDGKLVEFVDGCARCTIEKILTNPLKRS